MRKLICTFALLLLVILSPAQESVKKQLGEIYGRLDKSKLDSLVEHGLNELFSRPDLFNDVFSKKLESIKNNNKAAYAFLRDLNIKFKSFQADTLPVSLGLEYKYENNWVKNSTSAQSNFFQTYALSFTGNVAFRKKHNPNNFLESAFSYDGAWMMGGEAKPIDDATSDLIEALEDSILTLRQQRLPYEHLYSQVNSFISVTDQFYIGLKGKIAFESNQDFSRKQYVPGVLLGIGAKAWNKKEALQYFNLPDYPFALIRLLTGTDKKFTIYGATFPSFLLGIDHVIPTDDADREVLTGNTASYNRFRFEAGFKTRVARIGKELLHFSANYRFYKELGATQLIKDNNLEKFKFFTGAIESNNGLFVSFTSGKLPFDNKKDQVYAIGFKYNLGNW